MSKKPVSGTKEWASHVQNLQNGCEHDCRYCYAKANAVRFETNTPEGWKSPVINQKVLTKGFGKKNGTIMFPTTHDITPFNIKECIIVLTGMLNAGNKVLIVSKPHLSCIADLCDELGDFRDKVLFRFTIGSADDKVLSFWEPNAPNFKERLECLKYAFKAQFQTSVSCEPMLDGYVCDVVETVEPYITDAVWIGKPNKLMLRVCSNCKGSVGKLLVCPDKDVVVACQTLVDTFTNDYILRLYNRYQHDPKVKWKDSIKQVVGLPRLTEKGLDI